MAEDGARRDTATQLLMRTLSTWYPQQTPYKKKFRRLTFRKQQVGFLCILLVVCPTHVYTHMYFATDCPIYWLCGMLSQSQLHCQYMCIVLVGPPPGEGPTWDPNFKKPTSWVKKGGPDPRTPSTHACQFVRIMMYSSSGYSSYLTPGVASSSD